MQALESILSSTSKMLQNQIPAATPPCTVGQYHPSLRDEYGSNGCSNGSLKQITEAEFSATAVSWNVDAGVIVPSLLYFKINGVQYHADTHVSLIESILSFLSLSSHFFRFKSRAFLT